MSSKALFLVLLLLFISDTFALSCRGGRALCISSCMAQNCATGYCPNGPEGICVCSRCGDGRGF